MFALNVSGDPGVNLLAIITSVVGLFMIKGQFGRVYQSVFVDVIEMACYANLGVLSTIKLKFEDTRIVSIASHISGAFTVILLAVIISYHLYAIVRTKYSKRCTNEQQLMRQQQLITPLLEALLLMTLGNPHFQRCT